jgi:hypothetical protein
MPPNRTNSTATLNTAASVVIIRILFILIPIPSVPGNVTSTIDIYRNYGLAHWQKSSSAHFL